MLQLCFANAEFESVLYDSLIFTFSFYLFFPTVTLFLDILVSDSLISSFVALRMECCLLTVCAVSAALLFVIFYWLVQRNAMWALMWHDFITERVLDTLTRSTRPQVTIFFLFDLHADLTFKEFCYFSSSLFVCFWTQSAFGWIWDTYLVEAFLLAVFLAT